MTLHAHRRRDQRRARLTRVWLNGVEVTHQCYYADGRRGVVKLYKLDAMGSKYLDWREPKTDVQFFVDGQKITISPVPPQIATEERRGHVQWGTR